MTKSPEYQAWCEIKKRCYKASSPAFKDYGGRGIRMCAQWLNNFEVFWKDIGPKPSPAHSIDRIDNDGHYEPGNCRWATRIEQANNKRSVIYVTVNGERIRASLLAVRNGIPASNYRARIWIGWDPIRAATEPLKRQAISAMGQTMSIAEWAIKTGISQRTLRARLQERGWPIEHALSKPVMSRR